MRLHGILTIVALLLIAGGALPMLMGETMSLTGEHDGAMFGELLFTVGTDPYYVGDFKHTNIHESSLQLYGVMGGVEIPVTLDDIDYENGRYALNYLLSLDTNQVLNLDGTYADGVFTDLSGNGNHGTPYNGATTGTGVVGDGMSFDASNSQYLEISDSDSLDIANVTISCWMNKLLLGTMILVSAKSTQWESLISGSNQYGWISSTLSNVGGTVSLETWHHIVLTYDGAYIRTYLDGVLSGTPMEKIGDINSTGIIQIGKRPGSELHFFDGTLDEVRIYDRALTPDEVSYLNDCVDVSNIEYPYGTEIYASYTYSDTFAPIGSDLFGLGVSLVGCVMLIGVIVGSSGRW